MNGSGRKATIYDVAREAGVSHQTVSRFLAGFEGIRPQTRERVQQAIARLGYRPNSAARLLRTRRSNRIGVLAHEMGKSGPGLVIEGAHQAARDAGYVLDIVPIDGDDEDVITDAIGLLTEQQVIGIFATAQTDSVRIALERAAVAVPILLSDSARPEDGESQHRRLGALAARHLLDLGHRRIGYLGGPGEWLAARGRSAGFRDEVLQAGGTVLALGDGDWSAESGYRIASTVDPERITAVGTANDAMAIGLVRRLYERGIDVPDQISVIGFDDLPEARYLVPALTTVAVDFTAEGREAVRRLITRIEGDAVAAAPPSVSEAALIVRESTRAAAAD